MATFKNNTVTIEGRKLLVNSLVNGTGIEFTHFAIGDGNAPDSPENATALVNELFTVGVSKTQASDKENGVTLVRGSFTNTNEKGNFYWRELGIYARTANTEDTPVLFGYTNAGDEADYIPSVELDSVVEQGIMLQIVTGSATVLYVSDPTARATLQDIDDCLKEVEARLAAFTEESLNDIAAQVHQLQDAIAAASAELSKATEGFVLKAGDTMTGDLTMGEDADGNNYKFIGNLEGSASKWAGWQQFADIAEVNAALTDESTMIEIGEAMPDKSRLLHMTGSVITSKNDGFLDIGILEVIKFSDSRCAFTFTSVEGRRYHAAIKNTEGEKWTGWTLEEAPLVGSIQMFAGSDAPHGYLLCHGQSLSRFAYSDLFAVIGYTYGGSDDTFNLPDFRGVFPRGYDAGRGVDSGRKLGSEQPSGAPNITGNVGKAYYGYGKWELSGAFGNPVREGTATRGGGGGDPKNISFDFDASRSSSVYQNGLTEVRPANIAVNFIIKY